MASPIPREIILQRDEYFLSSDADYVAPLSVLITFLVKARKGEIPVRYKTVSAGTSSADSSTSTGASSSGVT